jgi:hypothetical protein
MILDALLLFSSAQAITADAASTNIVDLKDARDIGIGGGLEVFATVGTAFLTTNSGVVEIYFQGSTDASTWTTYAGSGEPIAAATLTAGYKLGFPVPTARGALPRYVRLYYDVTNAFTAGTITAGIVLNRQMDYSYGAGITIAN